MTLKLSVSLMFLMAAPALPAAAADRALSRGSAASDALGAADFSLTTAESFLEGSTPTVRVSGGGLRPLHFRLYQLSEPELFFMKDELPGTIKPEVVDAVAPVLRGGLREMLGLGWVPPFEPRRGGGGPPVSSEHLLINAWGRMVSEWGGVTEDIPVPGPGAYLLEAAAGQDLARTVVLVSDLAFEVKSSSGEALVYCADRKTGKPWRGARIWSFPPAASLPLASGKSDDEGFWSGLAAPLGLIMARSGAHFAVARVPGAGMEELAW